MEYFPEKREIILDILDEGGIMARQQAERKMQEVREKVGLILK